MTQTVQPGTGCPVVEPGAPARAALGQARALRAAIGRAIAAPDVTRLPARGAYEALRAEAARRGLAAMPLDRIREVTKGQLRLHPLEKAGYQTVGAVLSAPPQVLDAIPGVGPQTITRAIAARAIAARAIAEEVVAEPGTAAAGAGQQVVTETEAQRRIIEIERERLRAQPAG